MISKEEIEKIAKLAKLKFSQEELEKFSVGLKSTMDMIDGLKEIDLSEIEPLTSVCGSDLRLRKDEVTEKDISGKLFSNAPGDTRDLSLEVKCFVVPKVIE